MAGEDTVIATAQAEDVTGTGVSAPAGRSMLYAYGTWGGTSLAVQISADGTNWLSLETNGTFTENAAREVAIPKGCKLRAVTTGGSSAAVSVRVRPIDFVQH